jgi:hypothetical protein
MARAITVFDFREQHRGTPVVPPSVARCVLAALLALALAGQALAAPEPKHVKPDRAAINKLLDEFIPAVVEQKDLKRGWNLVAGVARATSYKEWLKGNTSVQTFPAKGTTFRGWIVNYSYPGDVGFDILLQPRDRAHGAWSFRAEAQKIHGSWKITTWYPIATFAPPGKTATVLGPNDIGPGNGAAFADTSNGRLGAWVLVLPLAAVGVLALGAIGFATMRWARRRRRVRSIERALARQ